MKKIIDRSQIDFFIATNYNNFEPAALLHIKQMLEGMDEDQFLMVQTGAYRDPTLILVLAIFTGLDRFFIDDVGMGVLKILTCGGFGIWWLVDICTAIERTKRYNYNRFMQMASFLQ